MGKVYQIREYTNTKWASHLDSLRKLFIKVDEAIHETGLSAMAHAEQHGDARRMLDLFQIMGNTTRVQGFLVWVNMFSPIRITQGKEKTTVKLLKKDDKNYVPFDVETAAVRPFWTLEEAKERVPQALSMDGFIAAIASYKRKLDKALAGDSEQPIEGDTTNLNALISDVLAAATRKKNAYAKAEDDAKAPPQPMADIIRPVEQTSTSEQTIQ